MAGLYEGQSSSSEDEGSNEPQSFLFKDYDVYNLKELRVYDPAYFHGCGRRKRDAIRKKEIPDGSFFYARMKNGDWVESHEGYDKAEILIKSEWVESKVDKFVVNRGGDVNPNRLREAPPILELKEHEQFQDDEYIYEVEVRGVRDEDKIFFNGKDIECLFEIENLVKNIKRGDRTTYINKEDYVFFLVSQEDPKKDTMDPLVTLVKKTFFTYNGLLKVINRSNTGTARKFRKWAGKVVYTAHLGTDEQRLDQALDLVKTSNTLKKVFHSCIAHIPCVYFLYIGPVREMRKHYKSDLVKYTKGLLCKYGKSESLFDRLLQHLTGYGDLNGSTLKLLYWVPVHQDSISTAETAVSHYLHKNKVPFQGHKEVVIITREEQAGVKAKFNEIYETFGIVSDMAEMIAKNDKIKHENSILRKKLNTANMFRVLCKQKDDYINSLNVQLAQWNKRENSLTRKLKQYEQNQKVRRELKQKVLDVKVKISQETDPEVKDQLTSRLEKLNLGFLKQSPDTNDSD